jgi:Vitamin B6 photo-protection and homoeostasis
VLGMGIGIVTSLIVEPYGLMTTAAVVAMLSVANMCSSYMAVRGLPLKTLNPERLVILQEHFCEQTSTAALANTCVAPLSPTQVAELESIAVRRSSFRKAQRVEFGVAIQSLLDSDGRITSGRWKMVGSVARPTCQRISTWLVLSGRRRGEW